MEAMLKKIRKLARKHFQHGKGKWDRLPADSSSTPPAFRARSTPYLTQSSTPPGPLNSGHGQIPERTRVDNGSSGDYAQRMEKRRTGSPYGYSQSLGNVRITNPDSTSASSSTSPASTSSNLVNYDPSPLNNLMTAAHHRKPSPPTTFNVSAVSSSSRVSVADDFLPMNDALTAAVFTTQVFDEGDEPVEQALGAQSPRSAMNPLRLNPPSMPMASPPRQESCSPLDQRENDELGQGIQMLAGSTRSGVATRRSSSIGFAPWPREEDAMASEGNSITRRPSSSSGPYRSTPLGEHLHTRIRQRRLSDRYGPLTTAEFPECLQTLGPYARFPEFTRSSGYRYPQDEPFLFPNEGVQAQDSDLDSGMSGNLTRPAISDYEIYRKSNSSLVFVDHPDEPDKDIYTRPGQPNRPPMSYMHTRYPRHLPAQLVVGAPFPSRGPVSSPPFCRRMSNSFVGAPRRRRLTKARIGPVEQTRKRITSRRQSQLQSYGSVQPASRPQGVRKYHAYMYNSMLQSGRKWNDYTIIESSRENSLGGTGVAQDPEAISAGGNIPSPIPDPDVIALQQNATSNDTISPSTPLTIVPKTISVGAHNPSPTPNPNAVSPLQTEPSGSTTSSPTTPNQNLSIPRQRSLVPHQGSARLRHRQAPRLSSLEPQYQLAALWLQQNNTKISPLEFVNVP